VMGILLSWQLGKSRAVTSPAEQQIRYGWHGGGDGLSTLGQISSLAEVERVQLHIRIAGLQGRTTGSREIRDILTEMLDGAGITVTQFQTLLKGNRIVPVDKDTPILHCHLRCFTQDKLPFYSYSPEVSLLQQVRLTSDPESLRMAKTWWTTYQVGVVRSSFAETHPREAFVVGCRKFITDRAEAMKTKRNVEHVAPEHAAARRL